jgi:hypothetical protein
MPNAAIVAPEHKDVLSLTCICYQPQSQLNIIKEKTTHWLYRWLRNETNDGH